MYFNLRVSGEPNKGQVVLKGTAAAAPISFTAGNQLALDLLYDATDLFDLLAGELTLDVIDGALGTVDQTTHALGYARKLAGPEDNQEEEPNDHQLLRAYAEHLGA